MCIHPRQIRFSSFKKSSITCSSVVVHVFCVPVCLGTTISVTTKLFPSKPARKANVSISLSVLSLTVEMFHLVWLKFSSSLIKISHFLCASVMAGQRDGQLYLNCEMTA